MADGSKELSQDRVGHRDVKNSAGEILGLGSFLPDKTYSFVFDGTHFVMEQNIMVDNQQKKKCQGIAPKKQCPKCLFPNPSAVKECRHCQFMFYSSSR